MAKAMEDSPCLFLGIKVKPGPIERHKLENYTVENTVDNLKSEVAKKTLVPSTSLELIHHGKILKDGATLQDSGVKNGEMVHVVKKKSVPAVEELRQYTDSDLQQIVTALWTFGCTPNAPGWTRAMQILNDESTMQELVEAIPSLGEDCVTSSILHEVELLAALGATVQTMRRATEARPDLPLALRHLIRLVRSRSASSPISDAAVPTSGFAYSLEALSEDEDEAEDEAEETERHTITQEQLNAALQAASEAVAENGSNTSAGSLLRLLNFASAGASQSTAQAAAPSTPGGSSRSLITPEMFSEAISQAMTTRNSPMDQSPASTTPVSSISSQSLASNPGSAGAANSESYLEQLNHMHEMGLLDDALNIRALIISSGDVNAAINLVFSGAIGDD